MHLSIETVWTYHFSLWFLFSFNFKLDFIVSLWLDKIAKTFNYKFLLFDSEIDFLHALCLHCFSLLIQVFAFHDFGQICIQCKDLFFQILNLNVLLHFLVPVMFYAHFHLLFFFAKSTRIFNPYQSDKFLLIFEIEYTNFFAFVVEVLNLAIELLVWYTDSTVGPVIFIRLIFCIVAMVNWFELNGAGATFVWQVYNALLFG